MVTHSLLCVGGDTGVDDVSIDGGLVAVTVELLCRIAPGTGEISVPATA